MYKRLFGLDPIEDALASVIRLACSGVSARGAAGDVHISARQVRQCCPGRTYGGGLGCPRLVGGNAARVRGYSLAVSASHWYAAMPSWDESLKPNLHPRCL